MDEQKRFEELAKRAAKTGMTCFTRFLEPAAERDASRAAAQAGCAVRFYGGYEETERRVAAFYDTESPEDYEYPVTALKVRWNAKFSQVAHRDLLGALMGLGIERDATGDILMGKEPGTAYLFCMDEMAAYIAGTFESAGRASIRLEPADTVDAAEPEGIHFRATVQNPRLDSIVAAGWKLSRSEAQRLISAGLVKLNHVPEERSDIRVNEGGLISARGYGRVRLEEISGETKKGRTAVLLFRYGK